MPLWVSEESDYFVMFGYSIHQKFHTCDSRQAGEGVSTCNLHTGHVRAAGVQNCEAVLVGGGGFHAEGAVGTQLRMIQGRDVAAPST